MRTDPVSDAPIMRKLDRDILVGMGTVKNGQITLTHGSPKLQHEAAPNDWTMVADAKGVTGFVLTRDVRSPLDYRAYFEKRKGRWQVTVFLAGD